MQMRRIYLEDLVQAVTKAEESPTSWRLGRACGMIWSKGLRVRGASRVNPRTRADGEVRCPS